jgi:parvulin-like peptidyl-prolyl isomerase
MMKEMRQNMPLIMWILVIAFLVTIVVSWGAGGFRGSGPKQGVIAEIGSKEILYEVFTKRVQDRIAAERAKNDSVALKEEDLTKIRSEVWDQLLRNELLDVAAKRIGLRTGDKEVAWAVRYSPPDNAMKSEYFQTDGQFDKTKWNAYLNEPQAREGLVELEKDYRLTIGNQKIMDRIIGGVFVTDEEARRDFMDSNGRFSALITGYLAKDIPVDTNSFTDVEIRQYFQDHPEQFWRSEARAVRSVTVSNAATADDSSRILDLANETIERLKAGEDFGELAKEHSDDPGSASKGGDLGDFPRGRMVAEFEEAAFNTPVGEVSNPIKTRYGVHIIKILEHKGKAPEDTVRASHILFAWKASPETEEIASENAREFQDLARKIGFEKAAKSLNLDVTESDFFMSSGGGIPGFGRLKPAVDFIFAESMDKISYPYKTQKGYTIFQCRDIRPEGLPDITEVQAVIRGKLVAKKKIVLASEKAEALRQKVGTGNSLLSTAISEGLKVDTALNVTPTAYIGSMKSNEYAGHQLQALDVGVLSPVLVSDQGAFLAVLTEKASFDNALFASKKTEIIQKLTKAKQNEVYADWLSTVEKEFDLRDNRHLYFTEY